MIKARCRNFTGPLHNKTCKAGVNYRNLSGEPDFGWMARLPCSGSDRQREVVNCEKHDEESAEDIAKEKAELKERSQLLVEAIERIRATQESAGIVDCPKCQSRLHFSIAKSNGHIWGKCETKDCLAWMM